jgi:hypothetical protein
MCLLVYDDIYHYITLLKNSVMEELKLLVSPNSGKPSKLDRLYRKFVTQNFNYLDENSINRWEVYNVIMKELITLGEDKSIQEIKYRLTDGENPNLVMMDMIDKFCEENHLIWLMKPSVISFLEEDLTKGYF